jgi:hypothetical protein
MGALGVTDGVGFTLVNDLTEIVSSAPDTADIMAASGAIVAASPSGKRSLSPATVAPVASKHQCMFGGDISEVSTSDKRKVLFYIKVKLPIVDLTTHGVFRGITDGSTREPRWPSPTVWVAILKLEDHVNVHLKPDEASEWPSAFSTRHLIHDEDCRHVTHHDSDQDVRITVPANCPKDIMQYFMIAPAVALAGQEVPVTFIITDIEITKEETEVEGAFKDLIRTTGVLSVSRPATRLGLNGYTKDLQQGK